MRRTAGWLAGAVVACGLVAGCGSEGTASTTTTTAAPADVAEVVLGPFTATGATEAQAAALLAAGCAVLAPADRSGDSGSLNDYFTDLFDGGPSGGGVRRDRHDVDVALEQGCAQHGGDPRAFLATVSAALSLDPAEAQQAVDGACAGYGQRLRANAGDGYAPQPLDAGVLGVLGAVGIDRAAADDLIEAYCGPI